MRMARPSPVVTALAGASCTAASAVLVRLSGSSPTAAALFRCAFALPVLGVIVLIDRRRPRRVDMSRRAAWMARCSGLLLAVDLVVWSYSIASVGAGLATVLGNLQVVVVAAVAWVLLHERPQRSLLMALPILLVGVALVGGVAGSATYGAHPVLGVIFGVGASIASAGFILVLRQAMSPSGGTVQAGAVGVVRPLYEATLGATFGAAVLAVTTSDFRIGGGATSLAWLAVLALNSQVVGWLLISASLPRVPAAMTSTLLLIQPAGAIALGALILGENPSGEQFVGVGLILFGVVIAAVRRAPRRRHRTPGTLPVSSARSASPSLALVPEGPDAYARHGSVGGDDADRRHGGRRHL
jgi:drug/metabolite transporter (DMT)-like permease